MIDYRFLAIGILVSFIIFGYSLSKVIRYLDLYPFGLEFAFSFLISVISATSLFVCVVHGLMLIRPSTKTYVNPSIITTKYEVTQVKTNLDSDEKTYELTSEQGDTETLSPSSLSILGDDNQLSKGDTLLKKQYSAKKAQFGLAYRTGNLKTIEWFLLDE
ncbi:hypothetical protein BA718_03165 [Streptococcus gallolyticus subsp. gallolyticus]|uniref:hypothetical protein n=1 Tax=Streptococcus gallolyticus TaxID=315405 RepID=UPI0007E41E34|nr:hypothetical protein [Streptococcus gallolyticus]OAV83819.1 hypothetical protein A3651_03155 [Streptococcus gallolyticus subsp. gallolyticus]OCW49990.1 hypothetical protein BA718_03165 [Streptococcus gallolyticus subsp. gallolyticus]